MGQMVPVAEQKKRCVAILRSPKMQNAIAQALSRVGVKPETYAAWCVTAINKNPGLLKCTPVSLMGAMVQSAQLGLDPSGITGQAYLVPYGQECTLIPGYRGLLTLARRSGEIVEVAAQVVREHDEFDYEYGLDSRLSHKPARGDRGELIGAYAYAKLKGGGRAFEFMTSDEINKVRQSSRGGKVWQEHTEAMWRKTVFRRLSKWLPIAVDDERAFDLAEQEERGVKQDISEFVDLDDILEPEVEVADVPDDEPPAKPKKAPAKKPAGKQGHLGDASDAPDLSSPPF